MAPLVNLGPILQRLVRKCRMCRFVDANRQAMLERKPAVTGDVIGVCMGLEDSDKLNLVSPGGIQILLDRECRIDDDGLPCLLVADEIRGAPEIVVDELPEQHGRDRTSRCGYIS